MGQIIHPALQIFSREMTEDSVGKILRNGCLLLSLSLIALKPIQAAFTFDSPANN